MNQGIASAAKQLESFGRGRDTMLAHITPDEAQFVDYLQGGRRTNPVTGLPEYGLFGKILKTVARVAGAIGGFMIGGPAGAAAGSAAATKLTGGSWKDALKAGAMSGVGSWGAQGLGGGGWGIAGKPVTSLGDLSGIASANNVGLAQAAGLPASAGLAPGSAAALTGAAPMTGAELFVNAAPSMASQASQVAMSAPGIAAGLGATSAPIGADRSNLQPLTAPPQQTININAEPFNRKYQPYTGDYSRYGQQESGWNFFDEVNPKPKFLAHGGAVQHFALGGGAQGPRGLNRGIGGIGALRNPMIASSIETPHLEQPGTSEMLARDLSPQAQRKSLREAAILGYMNARKGGPVHGAGSGKSDEIPAMLSHNEHVIDAATISALGDGDSDSGHERMEKIKQEIRKRAGQKNIKKPSGKQRGIASLLSAVK